MHADQELLKLTMGVLAADLAGGDAEDEEGAAGAEGKLAPELGYRELPPEILEVVQLEDPNATDGAAGRVP